MGRVVVVRGGFVVVVAFEVVGFELVVGCELFPTAGVVELVAAGASTSMTGVAVVPAAPASRPGGDVVSAEPTNIRPTAASAVTIEVRAVTRSWRRVDGVL
ncbi:hypothetical protein GCM10023201_34010 [Actinomycetospora corticicola]|uniref:Uncharacterized protein n=1 Tax=Actinomycetospora corticicola TaxID=663602 RepID=A0A7Y9J3X7_9PSEU|nr:hypothetical protein [Actinomycetospora corticicola]NYD34477.1 hypothetical protein [Actinomycetospora corticicola]